MSWDAALTSTQQNISKVSKFQQGVMDDSDKLKAKADEEGVTIGVVPQAGTVGPTTGGGPPQTAPTGASPIIPKASADSPAR